MRIKKVYIMKKADKRQKIIKKIMRKFKFLNIIIFLCLCSLQIEAQDFWENINCPKEGTIQCLATNSQGDIFIVKELYLYRSTDNSQNWEIISQDIGSVESVHISRTGRIFVESRTNNSGQKYLLYSDDNGNSWERTTDMPVTCLPGEPISLDINIFNNDTIMIYKGMQVIWTYNAGETWDTVTIGDFEDLLITGLVYTEEGVYVSVGSYFWPPEPEGGGVYKSSDDLLKWTCVAFEKTSVKCLISDSQNNIIAGLDNRGSNNMIDKSGMIYGIYEQKMVINDNDRLFTIDDMVLKFTDDYGQSYTFIGDTLPYPAGVVGGDLSKLYMGQDGHLFYYVMYEDDCDYILRSKESVNEYVNTENIYTEEEEVRIYPNPASESFKIRYEKGDSEEKPEIRITDMMGRTIKRVEMEVDGEMMIGTEDMPSGMYFYTISIGEKSRSGKLIVNK